MADIWSGLGDIGLGAVDTIGDFVESIGDNAITQSQANAAKVESIKINNSLAISKFKAEERRKDEQQKLIRNITYVVLFMAFLFIAAKLLPKILK